VNVLTKIERRKKRQKLRGESVCRIIEMNVEVTGDHKFMGSDGHCDARPTITLLAIGHYRP